MNPREAFELATADERQFDYSALLSPVKFDDNDVEGIAARESLLRPAVVTSLRIGPHKNFFGFGESRNQPTNSNMSEEV